MTDFSTLRQKTGLGIAETAEALGYTERQVYRWESGQSAPRKVVMDALAAVRSERCSEHSSEHSFTFIDLFAGIGGLRRGFDAIGGKCIFTCERDKHSQETYRANYPEDEHEIYPDITTLREEDIPPHDVLLAGFPASPFLSRASRKRTH